MSSWVWLVIVVVLVLAVIGYLAWQKRRREALQTKFGPEYDRTIKESDNRRQAERELQAREKRHQQLNLRTLEPAAVDRYVASWREMQARFVDAPADAIRSADGLVGQVMSERGYPMDNFEQRAADISVDHADVVDNYRAAHGISLANDHGQASTEDLRQAMVHYRSLFETLLVTTPDGATASGSSDDAPSRMAAPAEGQSSSERP